MIVEVVTQIPNTDQTVRTLLNTDSVVMIVEQPDGKALAELTNGNNFLLSSYEELSRRLDGR